MTEEQWTNVGLRIRDIRLQRGISARELGERISKSESYISSLEHGKKASLDAMVDIASVLDVSLDYLLRGIRPQMGAWGLIFRENDELDPDALQPEDPIGLLSDQ